MMEALECIYFHFLEAIRSLAREVLDKDWS